MKKQVCNLHVRSGERAPGTLVKFDSMAELEEYILAYKGYVPSWTGETSSIPKDDFAMQLCLKFIREGDTALNQQIMELAEKWKNIIFELEPSLSIKRNWNRTEVSDTFDAGAIASNEDQPCFLRQKESDQINAGKGDGAYRVIINTDITWWCDNLDGAAGMAALCLTLQEFHPVEIWIQQGWMGYSIKDGVTLFPIFTGQAFSPVNLAFWTGHEYKDVPFSWMVNRMVGRVGTGVAVLPELPCDLYVSGFSYPRLDPYGENDSRELPDEVKAAWIKDIAVKMIFQESLSGWRVSQNASDVDQIKQIVIPE